MKHPLRDLLLGITLSLSGLAPLAAQPGQPLYQHYTRRELTAGPLVWSMTQDSRGLMYLATNEGVLVHDGSTFQLVETSTPVRALAVDTSDAVYVGTQGDFGLLSIDAAGSYSYSSLRSALPGKAAITTVDRVMLAGGVAYFVTRDAVYAVRRNGAYYQPSVVLEGRDIIGSAKIGDAVAVQVRNQGILRVDGSVRGLLPATALGNNALLAAAPADGGALLAGIDGLYRYSGGSVSRFPTGADDFFRQAGGLYDLMALPAGQYAAATRNGGVVLLNQRGQVQARYTRENGLPDNSIYSFHADQQDGLWIAHGRGLSRLQPNLPIRSLDDYAGINTKISDVLVAGGQLYVTANQGVFTASLAGGNFNPVPGIDAGKDGWALVQAGDRIVAATTVGVYDVTAGGRAQLILPDGALTLAASKRGDKVYAGLNQGIALITREGGRWTTAGKLQGFDASSQTVAEVADGVILVGTAIEGLFQFTFRDKGGSMLKLSGTRGLPDGSADVYALGNGQVVRTAKGVYRVVDGGRAFERDSVLTQLIGGRSVRFATGADGALWFTTDRGVSRAVQQNGTWVVDAASVPNILSQAPDRLVRQRNQLWISLHDRLSVYDMAATFTPPPAAAPLVRSVGLAGDSVYFRGNYVNAAGRVTNVQTAAYRPNLPPIYNTLRFRLASPNYLSGTQVQYQFRVIGQNDQWSEWSPQPEVVLNAMPSGDFVFEARARDAFGQVSPATQFAFSIQTPLYLTTWAFVVYGVVAVLLVVLLIRLNTARLAAANRALEETVFERTKEVNRQKAELEKSNASLASALDELQRSQTQLVQSEKMAALGQLVAGVAHEINTPLGAINAAAGNLSKSLSPALHKLPELLKSLDPRTEALFFALVERSLNFSGALTSRDERAYRKQVAESLEGRSVPNASNLAAGLVKIGVFDQFDDFLPLFHHPMSEQILELVSAVGKLRLNIDNIELAVAKTQKIVFALKSYSHRQAEDMLEPTSVTENIDVVLTIYHNQLKYGVEVVKHYEDGLPSILCYPDQLNQVWTNIVVNAVQAMESQGRIQIDVRRHDPFGVPGVEVRITDSGPGIPPQVAARIFEPFFTTKKQGEGSGLGLDIVRRIVDKHRGTIAVDSEPGRTTFVVYLPADPQSAPVPDEIAQHATGVPVSPHAQLDPGA